MNMDTATVILRLAGALAVGAILGVDRRIRERPAGVRTLSLVSVGAALVVMTHLQLAPGKPEDVSRVLQGVITGIGFLGAGVIMRREREKSVEGLTTAASIWVAAALGAACGAGLAVLAVSAFLAALLVLVAGGPFEKALHRIFRDSASERSHRDER